MGNPRYASIVAVVVVALAGCGKVQSAIVDAGVDTPLLDGQVVGCDVAACDATATDGCCPAVCNAVNDRDCAATCGNSIVEPGETCNPQASCPTACPQQGCQLRTLTNPGTCAAACVDSGTQGQCVLGADGCCPTGCTANNDTDCAATCGNGTIEAGETCDPLAACPTSCPPQGCQLYTLTQPGTCRADCVAATTQTACVNSDGCCPGGCNANNDSDCTPACNNGVVEGAEACDPLSSCPTSCPALGCQLRNLANPGTCDATCVNAGVQSACVSGDLCCPTGCNSTTDSDCAPGCGNGVVEAGETCDPVATCPTDCPAVGCDLYTLSSPGTCQADCVAAGTQTACANGDGCCPAGCNANNDSDCAPSCGNGTVETGETCNPPASCSCGAEPYTCYQTSGSAANCNLTCHVPVTTCGADDRCCTFDGSGCGATNDADCAGPRWEYLRWFQDAVYTDANCTTIPIYGLVVGASYVFTTCVPVGVTPGTGDPVISSIVDNTGLSYNVSNDDCGDATALVNRAGWDCRNTGGVVRMSCASPSPGGFQMLNGNAFRLEVRICPFGGTGFGTAPLHIWYNAPRGPNPG